MGDLERLLLTDHVDLLPDAIDALPAADRLLAATVLIEHSRWAIAVTCAAIDGRWGLPGARAALRRSDRFVGSGAVRASIEKAASSPQRDQLEPYWVEINRLENQGDRLYRRAVAELFSGDHRAMDVLRWKAVNETLEEALDGLENVANVIEGVVLKNA